MARDERGQVTGAIDIGGTKIAAGMVDGGGKIRGRVECPTAPERGFDDALARMGDMLREAAREAGAGMSGIGIGCTGPVDPIAGTIGDVDFLPGWEGARIVERLAAEFGVTVAMENDADAAALAEARWGAGAGAARFIYVTISTGIGGGIVLDGRLYRGVDGAHPEIGHHTIDPAGPRCFCGARGCWEVLARGPAMAAWMDPDAPELTAREICARAEAGDRRAREAVEREGLYLGIGLANLVTLFTPDVIALGGGVMRSGHLFLPRACAVIEESCGLVPWRKTRVTLASMGQDAAIAGAACVWDNRFSAKEA
jgi:glucokinase